MIVVSTLNAFSTITRVRRYRLFEANVESQPNTPSAHRVRVQSSPVSSSPLRFLTEVLASESAESRAHPDKTRDVWELAVWDPLPVSLQVFCLFSPGHVLVYMLFLPLLPMDPRPSVTVFNCLILQAILSAQLVLLQSRFSQQVKDTSIIHREVFHEYDTKYVHPRLHPVVRDVGTQISLDSSGEEAESVEHGTPTTLIRRGFQTHPNPNYTRHLDEDYIQSQPRNVMSPSLFTPSAKPRYSDSFVASQNQRPIGPRQTSASSASSSTSIAPGTNFGGSLGAYSHANSPLKKATSLGDIKGNGVTSPRNSRELAAMEQRETAERLIRQSSPLKENRRATTQLGALGETQPSNPFANTRDRRHLQERFPSRW